MHACMLVCAKVCTGAHRRQNSKLGLVEGMPCDFTDTAQACARGVRLCGCSHVCTPEGVPLRALTHVLAVLVLVLVHLLVFVIHACVHSRNHARISACMYVHEYATLRARTCEGRLRAPEFLYACMSMNMQRCVHVHVKDAYVRLNFCICTYVHEYATLRARTCEGRLRARMHLFCVA